MYDASTGEMMDDAEMCKRAEVSVKSFMSININYQLGAVILLFWRYLTESVHCSYKKPIIPAECGCICVNL